VSVRPLVPADVPALAEGLSRLPLMVRYGRDAGRIAADLSRALGRGDGLLVEEADGAVRGLAWFLRAGTLAMGGYLKLVAVLPGAQGGGAGAALLDAFEAEVASESRHAFLLVSDFNEGAQRFYERHGYVRVGAVPGLVLPDVAEVIYWKRLR
jgi:ribosomal protein S18 acetylase RimI-like enzyme